MTVVLSFHSCFLIFYHKLTKETEQLRLSIPIFDAVTNRTNVIVTSFDLPPSGNFTLSISSRRVLPSTRFTACGRPDDCSKYSTFDKSIFFFTFKYNDTRFEISYGDSSRTLGVWSTDVVSIGSFSVSGIFLAVTDFTSSNICVFGIEFAAFETTNTGGDLSGGYQYENFPILLKTSGLINHVVYSLFLDEPNSSFGNIMFGAIDHSRYKGRLCTVLLVNTHVDAEFNEPLELDVTLFGIGIRGGSNQVTVAETSIPTLLDSGTTISYFPQDLLDLIASSLGAFYSRQHGHYIMGCVSKDDSTALVFDFGGFHVTVPLADF